MTILCPLQRNHFWWLKIMYTKKKKSIYTKNKVRPKITNEIVSPGESSVCYLLTSYLLIWLKMCSGNSWSWLKVLLRPSWIYLDGGDLFSLGWLASSLFCAYFGIRTPVAPHYILLVSSAQGEAEFSFLIWIIRAGSLLDRLYRMPTPLWRIEGRDVCDSS